MKRDAYSRHDSEVFAFVRITVAHGDDRHLRRARCGVEPRFELLHSGFHGTLREIASGAIAADCERAQYDAARVPREAKAQVDIELVTALVHGACGEDAIGVFRSARLDA